MRVQAIIFAVIFSACSGGTTANGGAGGGLGEYSFGDGGCGADQDCPAGMVCEGCAGTGAKTCLPGCRTDDQCETDQLCGHDVQCSTCPCTPGWCEADPCRDQDHDGCVPSTAGTGCALGKLYGDCDDLNPRVHPGSLEVCNDGVDNDCDGKRDSSDTECQVCAIDGGRSCTDVWSCSIGGETCDAGCCDACPPVADPPGCNFNECLYPGKIGLDGCRTAETCQPCSSSCGTYGAVCGTNYATYADECQAMAAGAKVLHFGYCWGGEGIVCSGPAGQNDSCGPSGQYYCRAGQPNRCTGLGFCETAADCPAATKCTDGGVPHNCLQHQCSCDPS